MIFLCSSKLEGRSPSCRLSDKVRCSKCYSSALYRNCYFFPSSSDPPFGFCCYLTANMRSNFMKASDQLRQWFEDDDALERAIDGE